MSASAETRQHVNHGGFPIPEDDHIALLHKVMRSRAGMILLILFGIFFGAIPFTYLAVPCFCIMYLRIFPHTWLRRYYDITIGCWIYMKAYLLAKVYGIRVRTFGHKYKFSNHCLIVLNHRCHFDWLFFWLVVAMRGDSTKWMVMLKRVAKFAPFFGWTMQTRNHFFLSRKWEKDEKELQKKLSYLKATNSKYQILMFPEGTDLTPQSKVKSDQYADANDLPRYEYVLHPKSTGFTYTLKTLRDYKIDAVYDISVGYPDVLAKTEVDMFVNNKIPREIHYHITRFDASTIPDTEQGIETWLRKKWSEKEERLRLFYTHREFHNLPTNESSEEMTPAAGYHISNDASGVSSRSPEVFGSISFFRFFFSQLFYTGHTTIVLILCYYLHWYFILFGIIVAFIMQYISVSTVGIDHFIMSTLN